ncbi:MAG: hypothetical protein ACJ0PY_01580 [Flavobacteriaceae bacterium]|tara:strand:+ start:3952 stop:4527 length:576 start_codon:yes stop_codon:yes gene_type:complete
MIDEIKDELKVILKDLETVNETSDIDKIISNFQELYKKMILFQFNKESENIIGKAEQKEVNKTEEKIDELVIETSHQENTDNFEDLFSSVANPEFITKEENKNQISYESKKLNESLIKGINIGLNDKIAFTKSLFDGNEEDYSRVVSQILTYTSWDEASNFLNNIVKPDYNNWEGKEEIEKRFLKCIESNF